MNATMLADSGWLRDNQLALMRDVAVVRAWLCRHAGQQADFPAESASNDQHNLDRVSSAFGLSSFERSIVVLCAGIELDGNFGALCASAHGDPSRSYPTFGLALAVFHDAHWSALSPDAPLRRHGLIELAPSTALTQAPLRIDEWLLHVLTGTPGIDARYAAMLIPLHSERANVAASHRPAVERIVHAWANADSNDLPAIILTGTSRSTKHEVVRAAAKSAGWQPYLLDSRLAPTATHEIESFARSWEREALLRSTLLIIDAYDADDAVVARLMDRLDVPVIVCARDSTQATRRPQLRIAVRQPTRAEQRLQWQRELDAMFDDDATLDGLAAQFDLEIPTIAAIGRAIRAEGDATAVWELARATTRAAIDDVAQRLQILASFDQLVLPQDALMTMRDIVTHVRMRGRVYDDWQMAGSSQRGLGISVLFAGSSGTGKTMAAEAIAAQLRLDLYRVDLSAVVSKYIGETEKNLRRVFDAAESGGAVLLFDEADALFGKRSEVHDSHDRYANIETSYLLQRMEAYRGLAILTTNMRSSLDSAFLRRLRFALNFPFPDSAAREQIWHGIYPPATPRRDLDYSRLARLNVTGGTIRNIAVYAAFLAAEREEPITMSHLMRAVQAEYAKLERTPTDSEIEGWL